MTERTTLIGAVGPLGGSTTLVFSDQALEKANTEPLDQTARALRDAGMQPEGLDLLVKHTKRAIEKRRAHAEDAIERLRAIPGMTDEIALGVLDGTAIPFRSVFGWGEVYKAAKHNARATNRRAA